VIDLVLVSVIMPSYNHEKYVSEAIDSVLNQSFADFELIIIDDCSNDNSQNIIREYQLKDSRIRSFFHPENMGISKTYNDGVRRALGKFIAFLDSDDLWLKTKLEKQIALLRKNEDLAVWSEGEIIDQNGKPTGQTFTQIENGLNVIKSGDIFQELLKNDNFVFDSSLILKKESLPPKKFDEKLKFLNDYLFVVDVAKKSEFYFIDEPLAKYRVHGKNTISNKSSAWQEDRIYLYTYFIKNYGNELPAKTKSHLLFKMGWAYAELGKPDLARRSIFSAIRANPFGKKSMVYLAVALTGMHFSA
jgi:glycosyltransferase involved in cell wall biosynthesis